MRERPDTDMARMLGVLNGGEVARRLKVTRTAVSEWSYAPDPPLARIIQVRELLLDVLGHNKAAAPDWERLMRTVDAIAVRVGVSPDEVAERAADTAFDEALVQQSSGAAAAGRKVVRPQPAQGSRHAR